MVELLGRYSNWANWTDILERLRQSRRSGRLKAPVNRGIVRQLSDEQVAKLVDRYLDGATMLELSELFEIHRTTVSLHLKRQGVRSRIPS